VAAASPDHVLANEISPISGMSLSLWTTCQFAPIGLFSRQFASIDMFPCECLAATAGHRSRTKVKQVMDKTSRKHVSRPAEAGPTSQVSPAQVLAKSIFFHF